MERVADEWVANDNDDWKRHVQVAMETLRWAIKEPVAANGLLKAAAHHVALASHKRRGIQDDRTASEAVPAVRTSTPKPGEEWRDVNWGKG